MRAGIFSETSADTLNPFIVYVSLPALVLHSVPWQPQLSLLVVVPWMTLLVGVLGCHLAARPCFGRGMSWVPCSCVCL